LDVIADFEDISQLNSLAEKISSPHLMGLDIVDLLDVGETVGGITLRQLSIGAHLWTEHVLPTLTSDIQLIHFAAFYAMGHARDPDHLRSIVTGKQLKKLCKKWFCSCTATIQELVQASERLMAKLATEAAAEEDANETDYGAIVAMLVREYGQDADYWVWRSSLPYLKTCIKDYNAEQRAQAAREAAQLGNKLPPDPSDPYAAAANALRVAFTAFLNKKLAEIDDDD